jgi:hypothetical protein
MAAAELTALGEASTHTAYLGAFRAHPAGPGGICINMYIRWPQQ